MEVVCVSAGMLRPKKTDTPLARLHHYLNYGLLGLATVLSERGYRVSMLHGEFDEPGAVVSRLSEDRRLETKYPLLLSIPSSFALPWASQFAAKAKALAPDLRIIVGGRWVTATDGAWIRRQIPQADLVVYGLAETRIERLLDVRRWSNVPMTDKYVLGRGPETSEIPSLDFALVDDFERYQPCVEVSRGCGMGCSFCAESSIALTPARSPKAVAEALFQVSATYGGGEIRPYFQASFFRPSTPWIGALRDELGKHGRAFRWRAESRVDALSPEQIGGLADAGLSVLDLGLESASPRQLARMKKTPNPSAYLRRASALLSACAEHGIWTKVNILLFPGETNRTLYETRKWLERHRDYIKGLSVGPMIVFRYGAQSNDYLREVEGLGASPVRSGDLDRIGYAHLHLSDEISHKRAIADSLELSREFMSSGDYFDLKSFSYFPRSFSRQDFEQLISSIDGSLLPFHA
jgi:radical SAM superfamily enzyme YgiQ (UPF0313 family)